jgi:carotenoid cleavage dioxygenase
LYSTGIRTGKVFYGLLSNGELEKIKEILEADPAIGFLHDYYLTEKYSVFPNVSLRYIMKGLSGSDGSALTFDADHKLQFGVIKKDHQPGDSIQWFTTDLPGHICTLLMVGKKPVTTAAKTLLFFIGIRIVSSRRADSLISRAPLQVL